MANRLDYPSKLHLRRKATSSPFDFISTVGRLLARVSDNTLMSLFYFTRLESLPPTTLKLLEVV